MRARVRSLQGRSQYFGDEKASELAEEWNVEPPEMFEKGVVRMLCLSVTPGEYLTIGDNVVLQFDRMSGDRCKLIIQAPREIPVVRGEVWERNGGERPDFIFDAPRWRKPEIDWDRSKAQALAAMRTLLRQMDGRDSNVQTLRRQLNHMFPPAPVEEKTESCAD